MNSMEKLCLLVAVVFCLLRLTASEELLHVMDLITPLDSSSIDQVILKQKYVLVEFFAQWCGHCKRFANEYTLAAEMSRKNRLPVQFAIVDAIENEAYLEKHNIRGYPSVTLYINGHQVPYHGPRTHADLLQWLRERLNYTGRPIFSSDGLKSILSETEILLLYLGKNDTKSFEVFQTYGQVSVDMQLAYSTDKSLVQSFFKGTVKGFDSADFSIIFFKSGEEEQFLSSEIELNVQLLDSFVEKHRYPTIMPVENESGINRIFHTQGYSLIFISNGVETWNLTRYSRIVNEYRDRLRIFSCNDSSEFGRLVLDWLEVKGLQTKQGWIVANINEELFKFKANSINPVSIRELIMQVLSGKLGKDRVNVSDKDILINLNEVELDSLRGSGKHYFVIHYRLGVCSHNKYCQRKMNSFLLIARKLYFINEFEYCSLNYDQKMPTNPHFPALIPGVFFPKLSILGFPLNKFDLIQTKHWSNLQRFKRFLHRQFGTTFDK
jgi:protein disulfide-isomerase-like protein